MENSVSSLCGKHIILGITGSIAAYKAAYLARLFIKAGAEVQIVMTPAGKEFITPVTLSALTGKPVVSEFFTANDGTWHSHVDLGLWADAVVIAPATAATIAKMASGVADNMLITTYLSAKAEVFVAPAMDLDMYAHPSTQANLKRLASYGNHIIEPGTGFLASHLEGKGRMEEPERIAEALETFFANSDVKPLVGKHILITAGGTHEPIDPVRFIGNRSSGKMGFALAEACVAMGAEVTLVAGPVDRETPRGVTRIDVMTAQEMYDESVKCFSKTDGAILCAAVADYRPAQAAERKIKRVEGEGRVLELLPNPDIAAEIGRLRQPHQRLVGFALESTPDIEEAKSKMARKGLDAIVLNSLSDEGAGFMHDTNKVTYITASGEVVAAPLQSKREAARMIVLQLSQLY